MSDEQDRHDPERQREDDEMALIIGALEEAGLAETFERPDGTVVVRLAEEGEGLRQALPEEVGETGEDAAG